MEFIKETNLAFKSMLLQRHPGKTDLIFDIIRIATSLKKNQTSISQIEQSLLRNSEFKKMWETRWEPTLPTMQELSRMPAGSLGEAYRKHLEANELAPNFYQKPPLVRPIDYLSYRLYNAHDIWHTLLAYDVSVIGELEIQAFTLGQVDSPASLFLISGGLYKILRTAPEQSTSSFERVVNAFRRGRSAKFLLGFPLEDRLNENLQSLGSELVEA